MSWYEIKPVIDSGHPILINQYFFFFNIYSGKDVNPLLIIRQFSFLVIWRKKLVILPKNIACWRRGPRWWYRKIPNLSAPMYLSDLYTSRSFPSQKNLKITWTAFSTTRNKRTTWGLTHPGIQHKSTNLKRTWTVCEDRLICWSEGIRWKVKGQLALSPEMEVLADSTVTLLTYHAGHAQVKHPPTVSMGQAGASCPDTVPLLYWG